MVSAAECVFSQSDGQLCKVSGTGRAVAMSGYVFGIMLHLGYPAKPRFAERWWKRIGYCICRGESL